MTGKLLFSQALLSKTPSTTNIKRCAKLLKDCFQVGTANIFWFLAALCLDKKAVNANPTDACELLKIATSQGCIEAQWRYGFCCLFGIGIDKNEEKAKELLLAAAEKGNVEAILRFGLYMETKESPDLSTATTCYKVASSFNDPRGHYFYGVNLFAGIGVDDDSDQGITFIEKAANAGLVEAMLKLGRVYEIGIQVDRDVTKAKHFYQLAEKAGSQAAKSALASLS